MDRKTAVSQLVDQKLPLFTEVSDQVWGFAELMFEERRSAELHAKTLREQGFRVQHGVDGMETAVIGEAGSGKPVIAILGEYDALSNLSQQADSVEPCPVEAGAPGHGCGHNLLGAAALAAATAVKDYLEANHLPGTVRYYGCPAEEGGSAKGFLVRDGYFKDVDIALAWHPAQFNYAWDGSGCLGILNVLFEFKGVSAHAAACPQLGRSALDAVELMNVGANFLREHVVDDARIHYAILNAGGTASNVVQSEAQVLYTIRAARMPDVFDITERVYKIAQGAALMTETDVSWRITAGTSTMPSAKAVYDRYDANLRSFLPVDYTEEELAYAKKFRDSFATENDDARMRKALRLSHPDKSAAEIEEMLRMPMPNYICEDIGNHASTDAGDVISAVPGCQLHVACYPAGTPFHSWQMTAMGKSGIAHKGMAVAAKTLAMTALDFLLDEKLVEQARRDHEEATEGVPYRCPMPDYVTPANAL